MDSWTAISGSWLTGYGSAMKNFSIISLVFLWLASPCQLKFLAEDFEGLEDNGSDLQQQGLYAYGNLKIGVDNKVATGQTYSGKKAIRIEKDGKLDWGGWGKGISYFVQLDATKDHLNFYFRQPASNQAAKIRIELQEDDNEDKKFTMDMDDVWSYTYIMEARDKWELVSIPLSQFRDSNPGGNGLFDVSYYGGQLFGFMITFAEPKLLAGKQVWYFDFISFSQGKLPVGANQFEPPPAAPGDFCTLGAWSGEGNTANFAGIGPSFESNFTGGSGKKIGIVHFFQPFGSDGGSSSHYPSAERINKVVESGYIPMISLENHFVNSSAGMKQPNLYSIVEGHFDSFLGYWAHQIKQVKGTVLLRILHEFNGDWYDWCTVKNNRDPHLVAKAYRYIYNVFKQNKVTNVRWIWCPNSMSVPQEKFNYIMDAYPGDEYVDFVALDIYNGAGYSKTWRSFRKEGIENYFMLTQKLPTKPLLICETASRERRPMESGQDKAEWIKEMSIALKTDMSKIRLLAWFNQEAFRLSTSKEATRSFQDHIMNDGYFKGGTKELGNLTAK